MKKAVALLALMAFMPNAYADGTEVTHSGDYRVRFNNISNNKGLEEANDNNIKHDFRWNIDFKKSDQFSGHITAMHTAGWGVPIADGTQHRSSNNQYDSLRIVEAYGTWMASDELSFKFGRGGFTMADGSLVHDGFNDNPHAFDGVIGTYDASFGRVSLFGVKGFQLAADTGVNNDPEINFWGVSYDVKGLPDFAKMINIHVIKIAGSESAASAQATHNDMKYGLVFKGEAVGLDYRLTYEGQGGDRKNIGADTTVDQKGSMMDVELGYSLPAVMNMRFFAIYHKDSGDTDSTDTENGTYDKFYYNSWDNAGDIGIFEWGNLTYIQAGLTMNATDSIEAGLRYTMFERSEDTDTVISNLGFGTVVAGEKTLGSEIDVWATKKYDEGFHILGRYSMFTPDDKAYVNNKETVSELFVEAQMMF